MKVLLCIRGNYLKNFAGDSMQVIKTAEHMRKLGVQVDINDGSITDFSSYDIIHLFNLREVGETYQYYKIATRYKKNVVITPLYWNLRKYYEYKNSIDKERLWEQSNLYRKFILKGCRMVFPTSNLECEAIHKDFGENIPCNVVYCGVDIENAEAPLYNFKKKYNLDKYVLCIGRIGPRKNQLMLAKVCNEIGVQLVLIGSIKDKSYLEECLKYENVKYLGFMDSYNMYNAYRFAALYALVSFIETPGISYLEAAASGCNILCTEEGSSREYFKQMAVYCNPYDEENVKSSIMKALKKKRTEELKKYVLDNFSWEKNAKILLENYERIIESKGV